MGDEIKSKSEWKRVETLLRSEIAALKRERDEAMEAADKYERMVLNDGRFYEDIETIKNLEDKRDKLARAVGLAVHTLGLVRAGCIFPGSVIDQALAELDKILGKGEEEC